MAAETKKKAGRPPKYTFNQVHANTVQAMSQYGVPQEDIASVIGMSVETINKLYRKEYDLGAAMANHEVGRRLYERGVKDGDTTALIFWAKTRMGWKETQKIEHSGQAAVQIYRIPSNGRE